MGIVRTEHFDMARKIVSNMTTESWQNIPHVCMTCQMQADALLDALKELNRGAAEHISANTLFTKIAAESLKAAPRMNAHLHFDRRLVRGRLDIYDNVDVSMASLLPDGRMMTLNVRDAGAKSLTQLQSSINEQMRRAENTDLDEAMYSVSMADTLEGLRRGKVLQALCRLLGARTGPHRIRLLHGSARREYYRIPEDQRLSVDDLRQGTVTVSNLGAACRDWVGECTILEIVPPQTAAIGLGAVALRPVADADGTLRAARVLPVTVAFDHRAMDTADAAPFIRRFAEICREPDSFLRDAL